MLTMCLQDWRIGRLIRTVPRSVSLAAAATLTLGRNPQRVGFFIEMNATSRAGGGNADLTIDGAPLNPFTAFQPARLFTVSDYGDLPTREIILTNNVGTTTFGVIEWFLPEQILQQSVEAIRKDFPWWPV